MLGDVLETYSPRRLYQKAWFGNYGNINSKSIPHFRHANLCNVLYGDFHAAAIKPEQLEDEVVPFSEWTYYDNNRNMFGRYIP